MRVLKKIMNWLSLLLLIGGAMLMLITYFTNKSFITYLSNQLNSAQFGIPMRRMLIGAGLILLALIIFALSLKVGGHIRKQDKERRAIEKEKQKEQEAYNKQIQQEAADAKAEAERLKAEAEEAQAKLRAMNETESNEVVETELVENTNVEEEAQK